MVIVSHEPCLANNLISQQSQVNLLSAYFQLVNCWRLQRFQLSNKAKFGNNFTLKGVEKLSNRSEPYLIIGIYDQISLIVLM